MNWWLKKVIKDGAASILKMKNILFIWLVYSLMPWASFAQLSLTIEIEGLRNNNGQIHLELSNEQQIQVIGVSRSISDNKCLIVIENLKPGKYGFKFFHDENKNKKLDVNWLGIPKEGFGFSNNPRINFGPPSFEKLIFGLYESKVITNKPKYF